MERIRTFISMPEPCFTLGVEERAARSRLLWDSCAGRVAASVRPFSKAEQHRREAAYDEGVRSVERELKFPALTSVAAEARENRILEAFGHFAALALGLEPEAIRMIREEFVPAGIELARWAERFDSELDRIEIVQACRNAWTACGLQPLLGCTTQLTPSILAYSLMYPYSDNFLDREDVRPETKRRFSARFRDRLCGAAPAAANRTESALWTLVGMVEDEFPRRDFPQVFEGMLAIHAAQERSVAQLRNGSGCTDNEVLAISCLKGGSSVLADAVFARGGVTEAEALFAFDWGVLLQLGDDLQDLRDDLRRNSATLFTRAVRRREPLDALVRQLLAFCDAVGHEMRALPHATPMLCNLLKMSWRSLIVEAVAEIQEHFSREFLNELEGASPFRLKFLRVRHNRLRKRRGLYSRLLDALFDAPHQPDLRLPVPRFEEILRSAAD
jgi:hypothetical protein